MIDLALQQLDAKLDPCEYIIGTSQSDQQFIPPHEATIFQGRARVAHSAWPGTLRLFKRKYDHAEYHDNHARALRAGDELGQ